MAMMERFQVNRSLYPLLCLISSVSFLVAGMLLAGRSFFWVFLVEIMVLYLIFGYFRPLLASVAVFVPISLLFVLVSGLINQDLLIARTMGCRVFLIGLCAVPSLGLPQIRLIRNLNQLRCPRMLTLGMLITVRFVPLVAAEVRQIMEAMKTRGVRASLWNLRCFYRALLIPLLMRLINISDTMALSLETRGFALEDTPVSIYERVRFMPRDGVYLVILLGLIVGNGLMLP